ncbi:MAG: hypothetical protein QXP34_01875 [Candidatus Aenigmatarchaeota archaeon]
MISLSEIKEELKKDLRENKISCYLLNFVDVNKMIIEIIIHDFVYYNKNDIVEYHADLFRVSFVIKEKDMNEVEKNYFNKFLEKIKSKLSKTKYFSDAEILEARFIDYRGERIKMDVWGVNRDPIIRGNLYIKLKLGEDSSNKIKLILIK